MVTPQPLEPSGTAQGSHASTPAEVSPPHLLCHNPTGRTTTHPPLFPGPPFPSSRSPARAGSTLTHHVQVTTRPTHPTTSQARAHQATASSAHKPSSGPPQVSHAVPGLSSSTHWVNPHWPVPSNRNYTLFHMSPSLGHGYSTIQISSAGIKQPTLLLSPRHTPPTGATLAFVACSTHGQDRAVTGKGDAMRVIGRAPPSLSLGRAATT